MDEDLAQILSHTSLRVAGELTEIFSLLAENVDGWDGGAMKRKLATIIYDLTELNRSEVFDKFPNIEVDFERRRSKYGAY